MGPRPLASALSIRAGPGVGAVLQPVIRPGRCGCSYGSQWVVLGVQMWRPGGRATARIAHMNDLERIFHRAMIEDL